MSFIINCQVYYFFCKKESDECIISYRKINAFCMQTYPVLIHKNHIPGNFLKFLKKSVLKKEVANTVALSSKILTDFSKV